MKQKSSFFYILWLSCISFLELGAQASKPWTEEQALEQGLQAETYSQIRASMQLFPNGTELAFAFVQGGQSCFLGLRQLNDSLFFLDNSQSVFEIASLTKLFTGLLYTELLFEGKLKAKDKLKKYLRVRGEAKNIQLSQLPKHSSGLPRLPDNFFGPKSSPLNPYAHYTKADLQDYLDSEPALEHKPGKAYLYSNTAFGILAQVLSKRTGQSYEELLQSRICQELDMQRTSTDKARIAKWLVPGLNSSGRAIGNWDFGALLGAGGIYSSSKDLANFVQAQLGEKKICYKAMRQGLFRVSETMQVACAWHVLEDQTGTVWHWHNGGSAGYSSSLLIDFEQKRAIVLLSNVSAFHPKMGAIDELAFYLRRKQEHIQSSE